MENPEIEELKELVQKDMAVNAETNRLVHQMRRSARWNMLFQILYWLVILGILGAGYYYASPYIYNLLHLYQGMERTGGQQTSLLQDVGRSFSRFLSPSGSSTAQ